MVGQELWDAKTQGRKGAKTQGRKGAKTQGRKGFRGWRGNDGIGAARVGVGTELAVGAFLPHPTLSRWERACGWRHASIRQCHYRPPPAVIPAPTVIPA